MTRWQKRKFTIVSISVWPAKSGSEVKYRWLLHSAATPGCHGHVIIAWDRYILWERFSWYGYLSSSYVVVFYYSQIKYLWNFRTSCRQLRQRNVAPYIADVVKHCDLTESKKKSWYNCHKRTSKFVTIQTQKRRRKRSENNLFTREESEEAKNVTDTSDVEVSGSNCNIQYK